MTISHGGVTRRNHNPIWRVTDSDDKQHLVQACDELQAKDYVETALKLVVVAVAFERASDSSPEVSDGGVDG